MGKGEKRIGAGRPAHKLKAENASALDVAWKLRPSRSRVRTSNEFLEVAWQFDSMLDVAMDSIAMNDASVYGPKGAQPLMSKRLSYRGANRP